MFLITPKPRASIGGVHDRSGATNIASATNSAPTRVANACDRCRLRKTKCNGEEPCSRCVRADAVCTFPNPGEEGRGPASTAYVSMLESQQRRLITAVHNMSEMLEANQRGELLGPSHSTGSRAFNLVETLERYAPASKNHTACDGSKQSDGQAHQTDSRKRPRHSYTTSGDPTTSMQLPSSDTMETSHNGFNSDLGAKYPTSLDYMQDSASSLRYNNSQTATDASLPDLNATSSYEKYSMTMRLMRQQETMPGSPNFELQPTSLNPLFNQGLEADTNMSGQTPQPKVQATGKHDDLFSLIDWDASWQTFVDNYGTDDLPAFESSDGHQTQP